jgi:hypothetical protein
LRQGRGNVGAHTFGDGEMFTEVVMDKAGAYTRTMVPASPLTREELVYTLAFYQTHDGHQWRQQQRMLSVMKRMNVKVDENEARESVLLPAGRRNFYEEFGPQPCVMCGAANCSPEIHGIPPPTGIRLDGEQDAESDQREDDEEDEEEEYEEEEQDEDGEDADEVATLETQSGISDDVEPVAQIDPEEAALIENELWASRVEHLVAGPPSASAAQSQEQIRDRVMVAAFSRFGPDLTTCSCSLGW